MTDRIEGVERDQYFRVGQALAQEVLDRASGRPDDFCAFDRPQNRYFISNLSPAGDEDGEGEFSESKPSMIGIRVRPGSSDRLLVQVRFEVYLRCLPTWEEYDRMRGDDGEGDGRILHLDDQFFIKVPVEFEGELNLHRSEDELSRDLTEEGNQALQERVATVSEERVLYPASGMGRVDAYTEGDERADHDRSLSEEEFQEIVGEVEGMDPLSQTWAVGLTVRKSDDEFTLQLSNESTEGRAQSDSFLFNPAIELKGGFRPYTFRLIPEDFRYDRDLWGKGINCSVSTDDTAGDGRRIRTESTPRHVEPVYRHDDTYEDETRLKSLADGDPIPLLEEIEQGMQAYLGRWQGEIRRGAKNQLTSEGLEEFDEAAERFEKEIENFRRGIDVLEDHGEALRAFQLMNRAFHDHPNDITSWRLFQLAFIVSNVSSIVSREFPDAESFRDDEVEVLWFPTGGGKTEAYLGLIVFALFFDRIRGKEQGVTAWIRFPLTLLGKQQMSRFLGTITYAEKIRAEEDLGGEEFSLGYFVGSGTTPNQIGDPQVSSYNNNFHRQFQESQEELERRCQVAELCPRCGSDLAVRFDVQENAVRHECTGSECAVEDLPLYVTDYEIYRNVPSVLLGTLDKVAVAGFNPRLANLLGNLTTECPVHGYGYSGKCSEKPTIGCDEELVEVEDDLYDPIPTLHLVDEVHLLVEELGVFAGHYETLYLELCRLAGDDTPKILTSSATISDAEGCFSDPAYARQMKNLFLRDANRFPEEGPRLGESFYGEEVPEKRQRIYYGITPNNKTHIYAVLDLAKYYHQAIRDWREDVPLALGLEEEEKARMLRMYELSVVYFLRKTQKDRFMRSIRGQIRREMKREGYDPDEPIRVEQLTADIDDPDLLDDLEDPTDPFPDRPDTIAATSFIGHGIDVDRFNMMLFYGFPDRTFEYVQTSSRAGRAVPGFVLDVFKPWDNRDRHRYKYFGKTHEYLTRTIEDPSVDRWSRFSLEKTFPGIFKGLFLQHYRPLMHRRHDINVQSSRELDEVLQNEEDYPEFSQEEFEKHMLRVFGVDDGHVDEPFFEQEIRSRVRSNWEYWINHLFEKSYTTFRDEPMTSLRDIGESVRISVQNRDNELYRRLVGGD